MMTSPHLYSRNTQRGVAWPSSPDDYLQVVRTIQDIIDGLGGMIFDPFECCKLKPTILLSNFATLSSCTTSRDGHFKFKNLQWMSIKTQIFFELNKIILLVNSIPREWRKNVPKNGLHVNIVDENVHGYYANEEWQSHIRCREERADSRLAIV